MSIIGIKTKIVGKGASYSSERARSMEAVNLQALKIGVQDSASPTEEFLGVNEVDSSPALKHNDYPLLYNARPILPVWSRGTFEQR